MHRSRKIPLLTAAVTLVAAAFVTTTAGPAVAVEYTTDQATAWAYTDSAQPGTPAPDPAGDAPIGTTADGSTAHTRRAYFTFDLTALRTPVLHEVNLVSQERSVQDCTRTAPLEIWRTKPVTATTTWAKPPKALEKVAERAMGAGAYCPGYYLSIDVLPQVRAALDRREKSITFEARLAAPAETDPATARTLRPFRLAVASNNAPVVSEPKLTYPDRPCGTLAKHPTAGGAYVSLSVKVTDADDDYTNVRYAHWPVEHPDQRVETTSRSLNVTGYADGTVVGWAAQAEDYDDAGPWSRTCYLTVDNTAPAAAPVVFSRKYGVTSYPGSGGPGVAGTFVFDAEGDRDVTGFDYSLNDRITTGLAANHPGGLARAKVTPTGHGPNRMQVRSYDAAGNRGPWTTYSFWVRNTAPDIAIDVAGVGLPSRVDFYTAADDATAIGWALDGGAETLVPVTGRGATAEIVFPSKGSHTVVARTYAKKKVIGTHSQTVGVTDEPEVTSEEFIWDSRAVNGVPGSFTFSPRAVGVVAYRYDFGDGEQTIAAGGDGTAVLPWTPQNGGYYNLTVHAVFADESLSDPATYGFSVIDTRPEASSDAGQNWPDTSGVGRSVRVMLYSGLPDVSGFVYTFDGGAEQETTDGFYSYVDVVPTHAGESLFVVRARLADGSLSPARTLPIVITSAPVVDVRGPYGGEPFQGMEATFTIKPALPDVVEYRYSFDDGEEHTLAAGPDGSATLDWTAPTWSYETLKISSVSADGTVSDTRQYGFGIDDPAISIQASWSEYSPSGGPGIPGRIGFHTWDGPVGRYLWRVGDGPMQPVEPDESGSATYVPYTPEQSGPFTIQAQREFPDGRLSPVTEYTVIVGTEPRAESDLLVGEQWTGPAGEPVVLRISGGMPGVVSYDYRVEDYYAQEQVTAGTLTAGAAELSFTPPKASFYVVTITGTTADGATTDQRQVRIDVK
ncbi:hypothetical protein ACTI_33850 [Actinoplanes sp. OR16]|uniref:hypothetical protein n=1 Tax=Actinoplanes sp. OR16 TaxID=946334 RepID=UPI000F6EAB46|nr:hypothetical protein [Actinoplanes sp. OR16]BBH66700.1 hypothetical protein ACTI_33850 [Actinoplanes sp. OR16]